MAIAVAVRGTPLHSTTGAQTYTMTDAGTPTTSCLLVALTAVRSPSAVAAFVTSFTGYGLTWTNVGELKYGSTRILTIWAALSGGSPNSTDPVYDGDSGGVTSFQGCHIVMLEVTLDSYAGTALGCFRDQGGGVYVAKTDGTGGSTTSDITLASPLDVSNRYIAATEKSDAVEDIVPEGTELNEGSFTSPTSVLETQWGATAFDTTPTATFATSSSWGMIGAELISGTTTTTKKTTKFVNKEALHRASRW